MLHELEGDRHRLASDLESRRALAGRLESGQQLLAAGEARAALQHFEQILAAEPTSARARELADSCRAQAREQEARERRMADLLAAGRRALEAAQWTTALQQCDEVLALAPRHDAALALRSEIEQAMEQERRRREMALQRLLDRATRSIEAGSLADAEAALDEADAQFAGAPAIDDLRRRLTEAQAAAEALRLLQQMETEEIRRARAAFRRGRYDEAVQQLHAFLEMEPEAHSVEAELSQLIALRQSLSGAAAGRRRRVQTLLASARPLADRGALGDALTHVRDAVNADPTDQDAAALLDDLLTRDLEQRVTELEASVLAQRSEHADTLLASARDALARGYVSLALDAAAAACRIAPTRADASRLADDLRRQLEQEDETTFALGDPPFVDAEPAPKPAAAPPKPAAPAPPPREPARQGNMMQSLADLLRGRGKN
jgi:tetratricopeptide (TPR) repeat protein